MLPPFVERLLWQQGEYEIRYESECQNYSCWMKGETIVARGPTGRRCWHTWRPWGRRPAMDCLCAAALEWVRCALEAQAAGEARADILREQAEALAEAAHGLSTLEQV